MNIPPAVADALRHAREEQERSLADVAGELSMPEEFLSDLEAGDFEAFGQELHAIAHVRLYARALGLDAETLLSDPASLLPGASAEEEEGEAPEEGHDADDAEESAEEPAEEPVDDLPEDAPAHSGESADLQPEPEVSDEPAPVDGLAAEESPEAAVAADAEGELEGEDSTDEDVVVDEDEVDVVDEDDEDDEEITAEEARRRRWQWIILALVLFVLGAVAGIFAVPLFSDDTEVSDLTAVLGNNVEAEATEPELAPSPTPTPSPDPDPSVDVAAEGDDEPEGPEPSENLEPAEEPDEDEGPEARRPEEVRVQLLNGSRDEARLQAARESLEDLGYEIVLLDVTASEQETSAVWYTDDFEPEAEALADLDDRFAEVDEHPGLTADVDLHVVVGSDFAVED